METFEPKLKEIEYLSQAQIFKNFKFKISKTAILGCKDKWIRKLEFVTKTQYIY